jgi:hypothetical protein
VERPTVRGTAGGSIIPVRRVGRVGGTCFTDDAARALDLLAVEEQEVRKQVAEFHELRREIDERIDVLYQTRVSRSGEAVGDVLIDVT